MKKVEKKHVTARVPSYVIEYCKKNKITYSDLCMKGFDFFRATDVEHALNRLDYHEKRVLHWKHIVLQHDEECNTKHKICNTIKQQFVENGRGSPETYGVDMNWIKAKTEKLQSEGLIITPNELYKLCIGEIKK